MSVRQLALALSDRELLLLLLPLTFNAEHIRSVKLRSPVTVRSPRRLCEIALPIAWYQPTTHEKRYRS